MVFWGLRVIFEALANSVFFEKNSLGAHQGYKRKASAWPFGHNITYFKNALFRLWWFCVIWADSFLSEQVPFNLWWFFFIWEEFYTLFVNSNETGMEQQNSYAQQMQGVL